jgi:HSP20 family molecular chaperone IbpA
MKRMYVVLGSILLLFVWAFSCLGQKDPVTTKAPFDRAQRRMQLREEMHRKMMESLMRGDAQADMFKDMEKMFDEALKDSFSAFESISEISGLENSFESEWKETKSGRILELKPQAGQKLDIDVTKDLITIKGKTEQKSENGTFMSSFSNAFPVPADCDSTKVKMQQKDGKILVELPFKSAKEMSVRPRLETDPDPNERRPLPPSAGDVEI